MITLETWACRSSFQYEGSVKEGTKLYFGTGFKNSVFVNEQSYQALLAHFQGRTVNMGTSRTDPPIDSVGAWLKENVSKSAIASYIGPILINESFAEKQEGPNIRFMLL